MSWPIQDRAIKCDTCISSRERAGFKFEINPLLLHDTLSIIYPYLELLIDKISLALVSSETFLFVLRFDNRTFENAVKESNALHLRDLYCRLLKPINYSTNDCRVVDGHVVGSKVVVNQSLGLLWFESGRASGSKEEGEWFHESYQLLARRVNSGKGQGLWLIIREQRNVDSDVLEQCGSYDCEAVGRGHVRLSLEMRDGKRVIKLLGSSWIPFPSWIRVD